MSPYSPATVRARSQSSTSRARETSPLRHADRPIRPCAVLREVLPVDARLVVVAVDVRVGDEAAQVPVAGGVGREEDEVEGLGVGLALLVGHRPAGDVRLDADDRLDALRPRRLVERDRAVQGAVIGQGEAVEALRARLVDEVGDPPEPVEQAELGVRVEVDEVVRREGQGGHHGCASRWGLSPARLARGWASIQSTGSPERAATASWTDHARRRGRVWNLACQ